MAGLRNVYRSFIFIALGGLLFGYVIGITSNVVTAGQLECSEHRKGDAGTWKSVGYHQCYVISDLEKGVLSSLNLIGALLSSLFCFRFSDGLGRKLEVQLGALLFFSGSLIASLSPVLWGIYVGLTVYGLGIGFAMHAAPVFIAEISPAEVRGTLVSAKEAVVVLGIFLGFLSGAVFAGSETTGWRYMVAAATALAAVMEAGIAFVPESPRFLVLQAVRGGGLLGADEALMERAGEALRFFRGADSALEVEPELQAMRGAIAGSVGERAAGVLDAFRHPLPLVVGCGLVLLQQVTGQPSVLYFATNIFKDAGFGSSAALSSVGVGLVKLLATLFTVWRVDRYGRRVLLFVGIGMMAAALALLAVAFLFRECRAPGAVGIPDCPSDHVGLPRGWALATVAALMVYVSGYQVGFGPIAWLMISEVFPAGVRGAALSVAAVANFGSNIAVTLTQGVLQAALTPSGVFFAYLAMSIVSLAFVKALVPETKGRTLEEIEVMLSGRKATSQRQPGPAEAAVGA